jgi:hypothetical protein
LEHVKSQFVQCTKKCASSLVAFTAPKTKNNKKYYELQILATNENTRIHQNYPTVNIQYYPERFK